MRVISKRTGEVQFTDKLPFALKNYLVPDTQLQYASGAMGNYIWQKIGFTGSSVDYFDLLPDVEDRLIDIRQEAMLVFQVQLKNSLFSTLEGLGEINLHEYGFNIFYVPHVYRELILARKNYSGIHIIFNPELLVQFSSRYPLVAEFAKKIALGIPARLTPVNQVANGAMMGMIDGLRDNPLLFITEDLLEHIFAKLLTSSAKKTTRLTQPQIEKIYAVKKLLFSHLKMNYTLPELSGLMKISVYHLKKGFPEIYGLSAANMLFIERMRVGSDLVQKGDKKMREIARLVGYVESSFIRAFKIHHGIYPNELRLKR
jgi:AraC-like DNA-binding protein